MIDSVRIDEIAAKLRADRSLVSVGDLAELLLAAREAVALRAEVEQLRGKDALLRAVLGTARYETVRRLTLRQFAELWHRALAGERFDELVDAAARHQPRQP